MKKPGKYSPEVRDRAVRRVLEQQDTHSSQWAAIASIAGKIGCAPETLRNWVRRAGRDQGLRPGLTTDERARIKALERELRQANQILRAASSISCRTPASAMASTSWHRPRSATFCASATAASTMPKRMLGQVDRIHAVFVGIQTHLLRPQ